MVSHPKNILHAARRVSSYFIFILIVFSMSSPLLAVDIDTVCKEYMSGQYEKCAKSAKDGILGVIGEERGILLVKSLMALGKYEQAARELDIARLGEPLSLRLLMLGYQVNLYTGQTAKSNEMLSIIYRDATTFEISDWSPTDLVALGEALLLQGMEPKIVLGELYNRALRLDPSCRDAYLSSGQLALDKQDYELAAAQFRKGIERFGDDPDMHYGLAKAFYTSNRQLMMESLDAAVFLNPNHAPSLLLMAEHYIDCEDYTEAKRYLDRVIAVNQWNPEALAFRCVLAFMNDDQAAIKQSRDNALRYWSKNPKVDYIIGSKLSQKYRFTEGASYQRQALQFDANYQPAKIQLAQDMLRLGREEEGWKLAEEVYNRDKYNIMAYNLVNLRDHLSTFTTLQSDRFLVRMDKREAITYGDDVMALLEKAEKDLCKKYGVKLEDHVLIEYFPDQQDFAVRTFGEPGGDGFLGVCFGNVITANSPKPELPSNWKSTLWHEFTHVVTLNKTKNKMPRWLSEGISVFEEIQRDPSCGQRMTPQYRKMILEGELTPVGDLSSAFLSPPSTEHLLFAYFESMMVVEYIVKNYGYDALQKILADLAKNIDIDKAISTHTESLQNFEQNFEAYAKKLAGDLAPNADWEEPEEAQMQLITSDPNGVKDWLKNHPNSLWALTQHAQHLIDENKLEEAKEPLNKLIELYPQNIGSDSAYLILSQLYKKLGQTEQEKQILKKFCEYSSDSIYAYTRLMEIAIDANNWDEVAKNCENYLSVNPHVTSIHLQLSRANEKLGRDEPAINGYKRLLKLDYPDQADLNYRLGRLYEDKDTKEAKRYVLSALAEAPRFRDAQKLLLKIIEEDQESQQSKPEVNDPNEMSAAIQEDIQ
ncbi:MAG: tetratricopeptide repeat protein [Sedimentisphaerales bacterium]|nr:tetratricopeptide repeat protein [Sedimentisphaerales bacterium]